MCKISQENVDRFENATTPLFIKGTFKTTLRLRYINVVYYKVGLLTGSYVIMVSNCIYDIIFFRFYSLTTKRLKLDVLDVIRDVIESVSEGFLTYSYLIQILSFFFCSASKYLVSYFVRLRIVLPIKKNNKKHHMKQTKQNLGLW